MSISATHITTAGTNSGLNSYSTASGSPTTDRLQLLFVGNQQSGGTAAIPTVTGAGLTWVQIATAVASDNLRRGTLFRALGAGTPGALTLDMGGVSQIRAGWSWAEFSGIDTSGSNGSGAIVQSVNSIVNTGAAKTTIVATLAAFSNANNATYCAVRFGTNIGGALTAGSGFTELGQAAATSKYGSEFQSTNDTTADWTWSSEDTFSQAIAVEIKAASGGVLPVVLRTIQDALNVKAGTTNLTIRQAINVLAGVTDRSVQDAFNIYAGTTGLSKQQAANVRVGTTNLTLQQAVNLF